jgi:UDP-N-acetylglucosamine:LPS N-acetylglucosamine transferase
MSARPSPKKVILVSSVGGHLRNLLALQAAFMDHERVWVVNDMSPVLPEGERAYLVSHAERDLRVLANLWQFMVIFATERPDIMLSTGAGPAVPAALVARLARVPVIHVEPWSAVSRLTLTGRLMKRLASSFYVQWPQLHAKHPWTKYVGSAF